MDGLTDFTTIQKIADSLERIAAASDLVLRKLLPSLTQPMTVGEVAELARVGAKTVYRWHSDGQLRAVVDGVRPLLFDPDEVRDFLSTRGRRRWQTR